MRILLDECVHAGVRAAFPGHEVRTVSEIGRQSSADGPLLTIAQCSFDVFVTIDRSLRHQQEIANLQLAVIVVRIPNNKIESYETLFEALLRAAEGASKGELVEVP